MPELCRYLRHIDSRIQTFLVPPARIFSSWGAYDSAEVGQVVVEVQRYDYCYYFPPCTSNSRAEMFAWRPFGRSAVTVSPFNFIIPGRIPCNLTGPPVVMVGVIEKEARQSQDHRLQVRGIAVILLDEKGQLDYRHLIMAAPDPLLTTFIAPH